MWNHSTSSLSCSVVASTSASGFSRAASWGSGAAIAFCSHLPPCAPPPFFAQAPQQCVGCQVAAKPQPGLAQARGASTSPLLRLLCCPRDLVVIRELLIVLSCFCLPL